MSGHEYLEENERAQLLAPVGGPLLSSMQSSGVSWKEFLYYLVILVLIPTSYSITQASQISLYETAVCANYYRDHVHPAIGGAIIAEPCNANPVKKAVALIYSVQKIFEAILSFLASFHTMRMLRAHGPSGRTKVLTLNLLGHLYSQILKYIILHPAISASINVKWTWLSSAFCLIAGGPDWRQEIFFMIIGGATSRQENLKVTFSIFAIEQSLAGVAASLSMHCAAILITNFGIWVPISIGIMVIIIVIIAVQFLPTVDPSENGRMEHPPENQDVSMPSRDMFDFLRSSPWNIRLLILTFLASGTFPQLVDGSVFQQYIAKRFDETIAVASKLQANSTFMNSMVLAASVIMFGKLDSSYCGTNWRLLKSFNWSIKDIFISRGSAIAQALGFAIIGISNSYIVVMAGLVFCAFGQPLRIATRCALISMTYSQGEDTMTGLFSAISILDTVGGTTIGFLLAFLFGEGLKIEGFWSGLPFFFAALLLAAVVMVVFSVGSNSKSRMAPESLDCTPEEGDGAVTSTVCQRISSESVEPPEGSASSLGGEEDEVLNE